MNRWHAMVEGVRLIAVVIAAVATALATALGDATPLVGGALAAAAALPASLFRS